MITIRPVLTLKIYVFICLAMWCTQLHAQSNAQKVGEADIVSIRQLFQKINSSNLTKKRFTYESSGCVEDGVVNYFFNGKDIVKITESGSIGDGSWTNEYYYNAGKVIFCFESLVGGPAVGKVTKTQYRYYIKDGRAIRVLKGSTVISDDSKVSDILQSANKIYKAYATKDFAGALCN